MAKPLLKSSRRHRPSLIAASIWMLVLVAHAQTEVTLKTVSISDRAAAPQADVTGFGDVPLTRTPISAAIIDAAQISQSGARRLADLNRYDASLSDAYNSVGYWDYATLRGFVLDNRFNYRRDGLPVSAETFIPLDNKERVEVLKGTSGIQAGTSAPGGLINYVVKRPTQNDLRSARLEANSDGGALLGVDLSSRWGAQREFGVRVNAASEGLKSPAPGSKGERQLLAIATDWRMNRDSVLEAELEYSHRSQASIPGMSLLGNSLPQPNAKLNINNQPWSQPVVLDGLTGSVRFEQALNNAWRWSAVAGTQRLTSYDRAAFPFGCTGAGGTYYPDRFCPNGDFDLWDFRSDNEHRNKDNLLLQLKGKFETAGFGHDLTLGWLRSKTRERYGLQAYNYSGTTNVFNLSPQPAASTGADINTNRDEKSTELSILDNITLTRDLSMWAGLRHTSLERNAALTDGTAATQYSTSLNTPWLALSFQIMPGTMLYASHGQGMETQVIPNRPSQYTNAGQSLPVLKSHQTEVGIKSAAEPVSWQLTAFQVTRPVSNIDACNRLFITPCTGDYDGRAVHRGLEGAVQWRTGAWTTSGALTLLNAKREGSVAEPTVNGQRPTNVPAHTLRAQTAYRVAAVPGLQMEAELSHEGERLVMPDGSIALPAWTTLNTTARYQFRQGLTSTTLALGIDNLTNRLYFRESPYQFGHVYLFSGAPRTVRISLQTEF